MIYKYFSMLVPILEFVFSYIQLETQTVWSMMVTCTIPFLWFLQTDFSLQNHNIYLSFYQNILKFVFNGDRMSGECGKQRFEKDADTLKAFIFKIRMTLTIYLKRWPPCFTINNATLHVGWNTQPCVLRICRNGNLQIWNVFSDHWKSYVVLEVDLVGPYSRSDTMVVNLLLSQ